MGEIWVVKLCSETPFGFTGSMESPWHPELPLAVSKSGIMKGGMGWALISLLIQTILWFHDLSSDETSVYSPTWNSLPTGSVIIHQKWSCLWSCCNETQIGQQMNKLRLEKTSSSDCSSQFHVFNLYSPGRKRPDTKLIVFFCASPPLWTFFFPLSLLLTLQSNNAKIPEIFCRWSGHLAEVQCYRYDILKLGLELAGQSLI